MGAIVIPETKKIYESEKNMERTLNPCCGLSLKTAIKIIAVYHIVSLKIILKNNYNSSNVF